MNEQQYYVYRYVGLLKTTYNGQMVIKRHNMYTAKNLLSKWPISAMSLQDLFPPFSMAGYIFTVAAMPYDAYLTADYNPKPPSDTSLFENHSGLEVEMMGIVSQLLVLVVIDTLFT